jgi:hypothetical protein
MGILLSGPAIAARLSSIYSSTTSPPISSRPAVARERQCRQDGRSVVYPSIVLSPCPHRRRANAIFRSCSRAQTSDGLDRPGRRGGAGSCTRSLPTPRGGLMVGGERQAVRSGDQMGGREFVFPTGVSGRVVEGGVNELELPTKRRLGLCALHWTTSCALVWTDR